MNDFVISISIIDENGQSKIWQHNLKDYKATAEKTAYRVMRDFTIASFKDEKVQWVSVALTINNQHICVMKGDLEWLTGIEYFQKFIGSMAVDDFQHASFGFIDTKKRIRVEFENGIVMILPE